MQNIEFTDFNVSIWKEFVFVIIFWLKKCAMSFTLIPVPSSALFEWCLPIHSIIGQIGFHSKTVQQLQTVLKCKQHGNYEYFVSLKKSTNFT